MPENTPSLPRTPREKPQPPPACWRKVPAALSSVWLSDAGEKLLLNRRDSASLFAEEYEAYVKQHDVTYKTEVTTTVVQEPSVVLSQYQLEQKRVTTPGSFVSETVLPS